MHLPARWLLLLGFVALWSCACLGGRDERRGEPRLDDLRPTLILISLDGCRWDYLDRPDLPYLGALSASGVRAEALVPVFPTKTFPNHYTIVTGLYPEHHGIVGNTMIDADLEMRFSLSNRAAVEDGRWWGGEPIWVTAERQGQATATLFWPGSEAEIGGVRPRFWRRYDERLPPHDRVDMILGWLDLPTDQRPTLLTLYFSDADDAGHRGGPASDEVWTAMRELDRVIGRLIDGLAARGIGDRVNLVIVSDHGMTPTPREDVIALDDYVDLEAVDVIDWSPVLALRARDGNDEAVYQALAAAHPRLQVFRRDDVPGRLHVGHPRLPPILGIADEGWTVTTRADVQRGASSWTMGNHGYDNALRSMWGIFVARGPAFRRGVRIPPVESIHVYALLAHVLGLEPAPHDGRLEAVAAALREAGSGG